MMPTNPNPPINFNTKLSLGYILQKHGERNLAQYLKMNTPAGYGICTSYSMEPASVFLRKINFDVFDINCSHLLPFNLNSKEVCQELSMKIIEHFKNHKEEIILRFAFEKL